MQIKIEIDSSCLTEYANRDESRELAEELIENASDGAIVEEALSRDIVEDILDRLSEQQREKLFVLYGYEPTY